MKNYAGFVLVLLQILKLMVNNKILKLCPGSGLS